MGLLDGDLAKAIYAGFKGKLLKGVIRQETVVGTLDANGDPVARTFPRTNIQGFTDEYSAAFKAAAGIPDTDLKVCFFAQSAPNITPTKDDKIMFKNTWYQVRKAAIDPADALWICQSFRIQEPVDGS